MKSFKTHIPEVTITSGMIKSLGFLLRNKLSKKIKQGKPSKDLSQKLESMLDAQGILGSIGIMNIAMEDKGSSLMSKGIIIRGLINELYEDGTITTKEKDLFNRLGLNKDTKELDTQFTGNKKLKNFWKGNLKNSR